MPEKSARTVFVVDDEPIIVKTVVAILNMSGFNARRFENAADMIHAVESELPDPSVTDVSMPCMNGIDLAIRFKLLCPDCKVVLPMF